MHEHFKLPSTPNFSGPTVNCSDYFKILRKVCDVVRKLRRILSVQIFLFSLYVFRYFSLSMTLRISILFMWGKHQTLIWLNMEQMGPFLYFTSLPIIYMWKIEFSSIPLKYPLFSVFCSSNSSIFYLLAQVNYHHWCFQ